MQQNKWVRSGSEDFFPPALAKTLAQFNSFPASKWGFVTFDIKQASDWTYAGEICSALKQVTVDTRVECFLSPASRGQELQEWARDMPLRQNWPGTQAISDQFNNTLAKAMVLPDRDLVTLMQNDPLGSADDLMARVVNKNLIQLKVEQGFLFDDAAARVVIPLHFKHEPMDTATTELFIAAAGRACNDDQQCSDQLGYTGGFFASVENKQQIMKDLTSVSWLSAIILLLFFGSVYWTRRGRLFALMLPVACGLLVAGSAMIAIYGGIHGLVLSFGAGIVGLSVDYGLHASFHGNRGVWRSNFLGLLTTSMVLVVIAFSSIPLMRQLMIFTLIGLVVSFVTIYLMFHFCEEKRYSLCVAPLPLAFKTRPVVGGVMLLLALFGATGVFFKKYDLNLHRLNYMSERTAEITGWLHQRMGRVMPLFYVNEESSGERLLTMANEEQALASQHTIRLENVAVYLPSLAEQSEHYQTWFGKDCDPLKAVELSESAITFFAPYLKGFNCNQVKPIDLSPANIPSYASHLYSGHSWLSIWMPSNPDQEKMVRDRFPDVFSLLDVAVSFPRLLIAELRWMLPTAVGLIFLTLLVYYRRFVDALAALIPFFCGLGTVFAAMFLLRLEVNFIVIVSILMLCGLSVDYGIFAVDRQRSAHPEHAATSSALVFAAASTSSGMLPLMFCSHPVLVSLGLPLCIGIFGALGGAFWAIPLLLGATAKS